MNTQPYLDYSIIKVEVTIKDNTTGEIFTGHTACNPRDAFDLSRGYHCGKACYSQND